MKAIVFDEFGPPEVLRLAEIAKPAPKDDEVLIRIRAASANAPDWRVMRGTPFPARLMAGGLRRPKPLLADLLEAGRIKTVIDRRYPLAETAEAVRYVEQGHARGKVIIAVKPESGT